MSTFKINIGTKYSKKFEEEIAKLDALELKTFYDELFERVEKPVFKQDILDALEKMKYINKYLDYLLFDEKKYYCKNKMTKSIIDD